MQKFSQSKRLSTAMSLGLVVYRPGTGCYGLTYEGLDFLAEDRKGTEWFDKLLKALKLVNMLDNGLYETPAEHF